MPRRGREAAVGVGLVGLYAAFWRLDRSDWKLDEAEYARAGWSLVHGHGDPNYGHPPLAKLAYGAAQALLGQGATAVRLVAALGFLASAVVLFLLGRKMAGWWTGVVAAGLFVVVPRTMVVGRYQVADLRIDRYGMLESVAGPLVIGAVACGWWWITGGSRRWALAAGALGGLAAAAKLSAGAVLAVVVAVALAYGWGRRAVWFEAAGAVAAALVAFLLPFAAYGSGAADKLREVLRFPGERARSGHILVLGDDVYARSPWWAQLRYAWAADGPLLVAAVVIGVALAVLARRRPAVAYLLAVVAVLLGSAMASPVALPHYRALWTAPLLLLVAIGIADALAGGAGGRAGARSPAVLVPGVGAAVALVVLVVAGVLALGRQAVLPDGPYRTAARRIAADGIHPVRIVGYGEAMAPYFPGAYDVIAPFDDGSVPGDVLVLDPSLTDAADPLTVEVWRNWARAWGLVPHDVGRLEVWWAGP